MAESLTKNDSPRMTDVRDILDDSLRHERHVILQTHTHTPNLSRSHSRFCSCSCSCSCSRKSESERHVILGESLSESKRESKSFRESRSESESVRESE